MFLCRICEQLKSSRLYVGVKWQRKIFYFLGFTLRRLVLTFTSCLFIFPHVFHLFIDLCIFRTASPSFPVSGVIPSVLCPFCFLCVFLTANLVCTSFSFAFLCSFLDLPQPVFDCFFFLPLILLDRSLDDYSSLFWFFFFFFPSTFLLAFGPFLA